MLWIDQRVAHVPRNISVNMAVRHPLEGTRRDGHFLSAPIQCKVEKVIHRPQFLQDYCLPDVAIEIGDFELYGSHDLAPGLPRRKLAFRGFWNQRTPKAFTCIQDTPVVIHTGIQSV